MATRQFLSKNSQTFFGAYLGMSTAPGSSGDQNSKKNENPGHPIRHLQITISRPQFTIDAPQVTLSNPQDMLTFTQVILSYLKVTLSHPQVTISHLQVNLS